MIVHEHLDDTLTLTYGPHIVGRYNAEGWPLLEEMNNRPEGRGKAAAWKTTTQFPTPLGNPAKAAGFPLSHSHDGGVINTQPDTSLATKTGHL